MPHKYAALLAAKGIIDCPCSNDKRAQGLAYRFVELPSQSLKNFIPRGQMPGVPPRPPKPLNLPLSPKAAAKENSKQCSIWGGLSMFKTEIQARTFFLAQMAGKPYFPQTHIAELLLTDNDGWVTPTRTDGHFDLHQSDTTVLFTAVLTQTLI